ncbi:MAG: amidase [Gemmataceae bacterium]
MKIEPLDCLRIAADVQAGTRSAEDIAATALALAKKYQDKYRVFTTLTPDLAQQQAQRVAERIKGGEKLPLAGVPYAVKDLVDVKGIPTTCASKAFAQNMAGEDAEVVRRLTEAGAVLIGKTNLHECAFGFTGENPTYGNTRNPWNVERIPGGSSSGSAVAVVLGICGFTLGSDTGGSIRQPAALCGIVGIKPTYGRVSRRGVVPLSWSLDHVGPMTRTAAEAALVLQVLAGRDNLDETSVRRPVRDYLAETRKPLNGLRLGVPHNWFYEALQPPVAQAVMAALDQLEKLGAQRVEVTLPLMEEVVAAHRAIIFPEAASYHQPYLVKRADEYDPLIRTLLQAGLFIPAADYLKAQRARRIVRREWAKVFRKIDCLATPTSPLTATPFGAESAKLPGGEKPLVRAYLDFTLPFNFSGHPALSVPCGFSPEGLPIGMQLVGRPFAEGTILRCAHHYQQATPWHRRIPKDV